MYLINLWWSFSIKYNIALILWHMITYNFAIHFGLGGLDETQHYSKWEVVTAVYLILFILILVTFWCLALPAEAF